MLTGQFRVTVPAPGGGLMPTIQIEGSDPDKLDLIQQCQACQHRARNRRAPDDDFATIQQTMGNVIFF